MKYTVILIILFCRTTFCYCQDTVHMENKMILHLLVRNQFQNLNAKLPNKIKRKINKTIKNDLFCDTLFNEWYTINFYFLLNEKGKVYDCVVDLRENEDELEIAPLCYAICKELKKVEFKINNAVIRSDTSYYMKSLQFTLSIDTKTKKALFRDEKDFVKVFTPYIIYLLDDKTYVYFDGFK